MSKFDTLFEEQIGQFVKPGPIAGDYVKFASNLKSSDWYSGLSETRKAYVDEIATLAEQGKPLPVGAKLLTGKFPAVVSVIIQ